MPPKKRASAGTKPAPKIAAPSPSPCWYWQPGVNSCSGRKCVSLMPALHGKPVMLCDMHRKCLICRKEVVDGEFALGRNHVGCFLEDDRRSESCTFCCDKCERVRGMHRLEGSYDDADDANDAESDCDKPYYCEDCVDECKLCERFTVGSKLLYGTKHCFVCDNCQYFKAPDIKLELPAYF